MGVDGEVAKLGELDFLFFLNNTNRSHESRTLSRDDRTRTDHWTEVEYVCVLVLNPNKPAAIQEGGVVVTPSFLLLFGKLKFRCGVLPGGQSAVCLITQQTKTTKT